MTTYNSYEEAKIANPECEIIQSRNLDNLFRALGSGVYTGWNICNPADYCMTVEKFLADGHKFVEGDWYIENDDSANKIDPDDVEIMNEESKHDATIYILRAAALEEEKPRTKVEYVKVEGEFAWQLVKEFEEGVEFYTCSKGFHTSKNIGNLISVWRDGNLHRRIETPITEREAFIEVGIEILKDVNPYALGKLFDSGKFKLVN